ncbi:TRAPP complex subunit bet5 [Tieghemiomyces parasiticus]|uniref:Trafficking protein particle complex subunit n=1 Tax=Tieghemiomyces parasiticus TaxID=78921 RepID=A0A9W8A1K6_9FUNG|nr:TRAPP complex subunit bet5 [Tieghemiomyces parasiticus]
MIYSLYIFDRHCQCIFYTEWNRIRPGAGRGGADTSNTSQSTAATASLAETNVPYVWPTLSHGTATGIDPATGLPHRVSAAAPPAAPVDSRDAALSDESKLVYGVVISLKNMVSKLSATQGGNSDGFLSYRTNTYRLHYFETASGLKLVMMSDPLAASLRDVLKQIYVHIFVEYVVKNALLPYDPKLSLPISNDYFRAVLNNYVRGLSCYQS